MQLAGSSNSVQLTDEFAVPYAQAEFFDDAIHFIQSFDRDSTCCERTETTESTTCSGKHDKVTHVYMLLTMILDPAVKYPMILTKYRHWKNLMLGLTT